MMNKRGSLFIVLGLLMLFSAFGLTFYNLRESQQAEAVAQVTVEYIHETIPETIPETKESFTMELLYDEYSEVEIPSYILNPNMNMPIVHYDGWDYIATISIPNLDLEVPVISEWSYPALRVAPCRYVGSAYLDNLIIAGHNYASHFGRLNELNEGEKVVLTDSDGNVFTYYVACREVLQPTAIDQMTQGDWDLTLFTCTVGGKARVTVRCEKAAE